MDSSSEPLVGIGVDPTHMRYKCRVFLLHMHRIGCPRVKGRLTAALAVDGTMTKSRLRVDGRIVDRIKSRTTCR